MAVHIPEPTKTTAPKWLWVNQDATSLVRPPPNAERRRHVMNTFMQKKRVQAVARLKRRPGARLYRKAPPNCSCQPALSEMCPSCQNIPVPAGKTAILSPTAILDTTSIDPFSGQNLSMRMNELLSHYMRTIAIMRPSCTEKYRNANHLSRIISSKAMLHAACAEASVHQEFEASNRLLRIELPMTKDSVASYSVSSLPESFVWKAKSIALINEAFEDPVARLSDETYYAIQLLFAIEVISRNDREMFIHYNGLQRLTELRRGCVETFDAEILSFDMWIAGAMLMKPILPITFSAREHANWIIATQNSIQHRASLSLTLHPEIQRLVPPSVLPIYDDLHLLTTYLNLRRTSTATPYTGALMKRVYHIDHRLLSTPPGTEPPFALCIRIAALMFTEMATVECAPGLRTRSRNLSFRLMQELIHINQEEIRNTFPALLFWVLSIGAMATAGMQQGSWFVLQLRKVAEKLLMKSFRGASSMMESVFYSEGTMGMDYAVVWDDVQNGKAGLGRGNGSRRVGVES